MDNIPQPPTFWEYAKMLAQQARRAGSPFHWQELCIVAFTTVGGTTVAALSTDGIDWGDLGGGVVGGLSGIVGIFIWYLVRESHRVYSEQWQRLRQQSAGERLRQ